MARRFQANEQTIHRDLQATMRKLGATSLRIPRDYLDDKNAQAEIVFDRAGRRYAIRCKEWSHYLDDLRASERAIYYLYRAIDEYGVTTNEKNLGDLFTQFFSGFEALSDDTVLMLGSGRSEWWEVLGVDPNATVLEIRNAYRSLARTHHPEPAGSQTSSSGCGRPTSKC